MLKPQDRPFWVGGQLGSPQGNVMDGKAVELRGASPAHPASAFLTAANTATANAAANTKGTYVELVSAANLVDDVYGFQLILPTSALSRDALVDIAVGGAGTEVVVVANILNSMPKSGRWSIGSPMPLFIGRGQRIAARVQASVGSTTQEVYLYLFFRNGWTRIYRTCETMGAATGDSGGTSIDPGGTVNTEGAWIELTAATTRRIRLISLALGNQNNQIRTSCQWFFDIAWGAAGSEIQVVQDMSSVVDQALDYPTPMFYGPLPVDIPAGARVAARAQCNINDATDRLIDLAAYGFTV